MIKPVFSEVSFKSILVVLLDLFL